MAKESTAEGDGVETKKKRKASRACQSCQKAHLTCSDVRPCARCIKRGDECIEGAKKKARYLLTPEELAELAKEPPKPKRPRVSKAKEAAAAAASAPSPPKPTSPPSSTSTSAQPPPTSSNQQPHPHRNSIDTSDPSYLYPQYPNFLPAQNPTTAANFFPASSAPYNNFPSNTSQLSSHQRQLAMTQQQQQQQQQSQQGFHSIPSHPQSSERMAEDDEDEDDDASSDADASGTTEGVSMRVDETGSEVGTGMNDSAAFGDDASQSNLVNPHLHRHSFSNDQPPSLSQNQLPSSLLSPLSNNLLPFPSPTSSSQIYPSNILQNQNPAPRSSSSHISDSQPQSSTLAPPSSDPRNGNINSSGGANTWTWEGAQVPPPWEGFHPGAGQQSMHSIIPASQNGAFDVVMGGPGGGAGVEDLKGKGKERDRVEIVLGKAYNYSDGYTRLLEFATERFGQLDTLRLVRSLAEFRPKMLTMSATQTPESLAFKEEAFQRSLTDLTTILLPLTGTPTAVWRRTGELVAVGQEFSILTEWPLSELLYVPKEKKDVARTGGGPAWQGKHIWEVLQQKSTVEYFEEFGKRAFDGTMGGSFKAHATLMTPQGRAVSCCASFTVRRDLFDLPSLIIGQFLPLL